MAVEGLKNSAVNANAIRINLTSFAGSQFRGAVSQVAEARKESTCTIYVKAKTEKELYFANRMQVTATIFPKDENGNTLHLSPTSVTVGKEAILGRYHFNTAKAQGKISETNFVRTFVFEKPCLSNFVINGECIINNERIPATVVLPK